MSLEGLDCWDDYPMEHGCVCGNDCPPPSLPEAEPMSTERPPDCCGVCPETVSGGDDCTCAGNPRCPNYEGDDE